MFISELNQVENSKLLKFIDKEFNNLAIEYEGCNFYRKKNYNRKNKNFDRKWFGKKIKKNKGIRNRRTKKNNDSYYT